MSTLFFTLQDQLENYLLVDIRFLNFYLDDYVVAIKMYLLWGWTGKFVFLIMWRVKVSVFC